jgi:SAM-dependent methyltransferase
MSAYYDTIMTNGYYDYQRIANELMRYSFSGNSLEVGCGTGLILEELAQRCSIGKIVGIDFTQAMLAIAQERLRRFSNVQLVLGNVLHLSWQQTFDLAFSYGGAWYFSRNANAEPVLVSHIIDEGDNHQGLEQVSKHLAPGGSLLLGIQGPHHDYHTAISGGMTYCQQITPQTTGFIKDYSLSDGATVLMQQTTQYRTYSFKQAKAMLASHGLTYQADDTSQLFMEFKKR